MPKQNDEDIIIATTEPVKEGIFAKKQYISNHYSFYIDEDIEISSNYRELFNILREAEENDVVTLVINSRGGYLETAVQIYNYLLMTKATTIAEVHTAYSAAAMIALSCDNILLGRFSSMLIHTASSGVGGKAEDMKRYSDFLNDWNIKICKDVYKGFLTDKEIIQVCEGKEFWLLEEEVMKRLKSWTPVRSRKKDKK